MSLIDVSNNEIFIADDEVAVRDSLSLVFTIEGYRVTTFRDGQSFVNAARIKSPACALLDVYMPGKSGLDILKEVDAKNYSAPIIVMSGRGDAPIIVEAIKGGAYDFIEKRLNADAMVARVRYTIDCWVQQRKQNGNGGEPQLIFPGCELLTPREREVLSQVLAAVSSQEAAKNLGISKRTVEIHRVHMMQKLGVKNTVDLVCLVLGKKRRT